MFSGKPSNLHFSCILLCFLCSPKELLLKRAMGSSFFLVDNISTHAILESCELLNVTAAKTDVATITFENPNERIHSIKVFF